jgi:coenzyme F420-reducing hydrogenase beta subunit
MARYGLTLGYQKEKCSICGFMKEIRILYDNEAHRIVRICDSCVNEQGEKTSEQIVQEFGKKTTAKHIKILSSAQMEKSGFEITGKKPERLKKS